MGKLVKDKIPQIIAGDGKSPIIRTLSTEEYLEELDIKLNEEVAEYQADKLYPPQERKLDDVKKYWKLILTVYKSAQNCGFGEWKYI